MLIVGTLLTCISLTILVNKLDHVLEKRIFIPAIFLSSIAFVYFNRKKATMLGKAWVDESSIDFATPKLNEKVQFTEISRYKVEWYHGATLKLWLHDGRKIFFQSNDNFHTSDELGAICRKVMRSIERYNERAPIKIERKKSIFEGKWVYPALIIFTLMVVAVIIYALVTGKKISGSFFLGLSSLAMLWGGYWSTKRNLRFKS